MTDKELLEFAAKAAGMTPGINGYMEPCFFDGRNEWNPLTDDGDALRLVVKLNFDINSYKGSKEVAAVQHSQRTKAYTRSIEKYSDDKHAATRRAIVRAAAEIGKEMK